VLSGTTEALLEGSADIAIGSSIPQGFLGEPLMQIRFVPMAHPDHPLHQLGRPLDARDLSQHRRLVVRETGARTDDRNLIASEQRWTVSNKATSIHAACMGAGFAWYPETSVKNELDTGLLQPLPLRDGATRFATLYLMLADPDCQGPALEKLVSIIKATTRKFESDQKPTPALR
jgi:DNA-binding transcriptional LysR family regulator